MQTGEKKVSVEKSSIILGTTRFFFFIVFSFAYWSSSSMKSVVWIDSIVFSFTTGVLLSQLLWLRELVWNPVLHIFFKILLFVKTLEGKNEGILV